MTLSDVEWDACVLEPHHDRELESYMRRELGAVPSAVPYFTASPWLVRSMASLSYYGAPLVHLSYVLADLVGLVVSQDNSCRYCYAIQRTVMRVHGLPEGRIRQIEQNFLEAEIEPRTKLALEFARRISRAAPLVSASDAQPLRAAGWEPQALKELVYQSAYQVFMNRLMTMAAIPIAPVERQAEHWVLGWIAPVMRLVMRRRWRTAGATPLPAELRVGPWSYLVCALDGLPAARALRTTLDGMWDSPLLSRRAKALTFAVVARGLDCASGEREARSLLEATGLAAAEIEPILTHLGSPALDPIEAAIVPFARGTIRGRPTQLQQRTRALRERLRSEEIVETVGVCALANAICRLGVVAQIE
jgi:alkylhydroperoxidase family enzyme